MSDPILIPQDADFTCEFQLPDDDRCVVGHLAGNRCPLRRAEGDYICEQHQVEYGKPMDAKP